MLGHENTLSSPLFQNGGREWLGSIQILNFMRKSPFRQRWMILLLFLLWAGGSSGSWANNLALNFSVLFDIFHLLRFCFVRVILTETCFNSWALRGWKEGVFMCNCTTHNILMMKEAHSEHLGKDSFELLVSGNLNECHGLLLLVFGDSQWLLATAIDGSCRLSSDFISDQVCKQRKLHFSLSFATLVPLRWHGGHPVLS